MMVNSHATTALARYYAGEPMPQHSLDLDTADAIGMIRKHALPLVPKLIVNAAQKLRFETHTSACTCESESVNTEIYFLWQLQRN